MPEMNGVAVIDRARTRQPGLKVLLMSGHADILHTGGASGIPLLAKPFKLDELRRKIVDVLPMPPSGTGPHDASSQLLAVSK